MSRRRDVISTINAPPRRRGRSRGPRHRRGGVGPTGVLAVLVAGALIGAGAIFLFNSLSSDPVTVRVLGIDGPIEAATVVTPNGDQTLTVEDGSAELEFSAPAMLQVTAPGYEQATFDVQAIPNPGPLFLQMNPVVLKGRVVGPNGQAVTGAAVRVGERNTKTNELGAFEVIAAVPGEVEVTKAAWLPTATAWDGGDGRLTVDMEPFIVRGLRVSAAAVADPEKFAEILDLADTTAVNTLVFDTKPEGGEIVYQTSVQEAIDIGAVKPAYDVDLAIEEARKRGLYTITRVVTFQDFYRAQARPEHAIRNTETGGVWTNVKGLGWMDPTDPEAWTYPIALAKEACQLGFDEIQFDYVRFPTDGDITVTGYDAGPLDEDIRIETIAGFLSTAREELTAMGCATSADIFGIVMSVGNDQGLGQLPETLSYAVDAVSPMIYPSHYSSGWMGLDNPNSHPGEVVGEAIETGTPKLEGGAVLRPWLQAFSWTNEQILDSIDAAERNGLGWMLWHSGSVFEAGALPSDL